jgi:amidase
MDPTFLPATQLADLTRGRKIGCLELLDHYIARVERLDPALNAVVVRDFDRARTRAGALDQVTDRSAPLFGVPMTVKESFNVQGLKTTWGVPAQRGNTASANALAVDRLLDAGAVIFGKTNVPLLLSDWQSFNEIYGTTNNPWDLALSPGGSSGGAAAALAAGLTGLEAGSDIGSSIRNPAHYCGVFGHKPTWGICPPLGHSLGAVAQSDISVIGPLARSAADLAVALDVMAGAEPMEAGWKLDLPPPRTTGFKGLRVAVMAEHPLAETDASITGGLHALADFLRAQGAIVSPDARPDFDLAEAHRLFIEILRATTSARTDAAAMARWQQQAGGLAEDDSSYQAMMVRGVTMTHRDFLIANERRQKMRRQWARFFQDWDVFLCPPAASPAQPHDQMGERWERHITVNGHRVPATDQMFWAGISGLFLLPATVAPLAASPTGLPVGVQIVGPQYGDRTTIAFASWLERDWRGFTPPPDLERRLGNT